MTTIDTVSLALLWQRWQEIETDEKEIARADAGDKTLFAELNAIEKQIIDQPAETFSDLLAKLRFLAHILHDHDWDDIRVEPLYASIADGLSNQIPHRNPLSRLEDALFKIKGVSECLESVSRDAPEPAKVCDYLGQQLREHAEQAEEALSELYDEKRTKEHFLKRATTPKPEDAKLGLANLVISAWPKITVCEVEGARQMLQFMLDAMPAPIRPPKAKDTAQPAVAEQDAQPALDPLPESFAAAEKEIAELWARAENADDADDVQEPITSRAFALDRWILKTAPSTLAEAAIKLRRLADPHTGMETGEGEHDALCAQQVLAFIEAEMAGNAAQ
jgi:hypothetical protein